jgi:hypothetical protein
MTTTSPALADRKGPNHATVFVWLFAVSAIWHYTSSGSEIVGYWMHYDPLVTPLIFLSIATAFVAAIYPDRTAALLVMSAGQLIANYFRYPFVADHLVMEIFLNLSIMLSYCYLAFRRRSFKVTTSEMFELFSPVGRWLLMTMYLFGTFHKINPGFMSVASSCAVPFIDGFPVYASRLGQVWPQYAAIYGTLILEATAMFLLLSARTKYFGMLLGMSFHFIIGISSYGTLAHFSAFALALHVLFVPSSFGERIYQEPLIPAFLKTDSAFKVLTVILIALQIGLAFHLMKTHQGYLVNSLFAVYGVALLFLVFKHGQIRDSDAPYRLKSPFMALNLVPIWFLLHCMSPYVGLGTGGTMAMFSGLRTEGGISNHYIITKPIPLFSYQDKIVYIEEASNPSMQAAADDEQGIVMFDFQRHIMQRENIMLPIRLRVGDVSYAITDPESFAAFANEHFTEQSWLERKYMSFRLVDSPTPDRCRH